MGCKLSVMDSLVPVWAPESLDKEQESGPYGVLLEFPGHGETIYCPRKGGFIFHSKNFPSRAYSRCPSWAFWLDFPPI